MKKRKIIYYVTGQYMRKNPKRTLTTFFGIVFMVMLMTCVFVGKDTAILYLRDVASQKDGKWDASMYDIGKKELEQVEALPYVAEMALSKNAGLTEFAQSANAERPYLLVKQYGEMLFDWMNVRVSEGRLPQAANEIVISESARGDGAKIALGDVIEADFFERSITGVEDSVETFFPFFGVRVREGETVPVPEDFPYYPGTESFVQNQEFLSKKASYEVVGFIETPSYESAGAAGYTALTLYDETVSETDVFRLTMRLDLKKLKNEGERWGAELQKIAGASKLDFNDYVLIFSGDSSESTINYMIRLLQIFFVILIMASSIVLIYNIFCLSFKERSSYLGILASMGATARQKRSSIYYEVGLLLICALPVGVLAGLGVILAGMALLKPYLVRFVFMGQKIAEVPVQLQISPGAMGMVLAAAIVTVVFSAMLPARKIGKIGPIECIRGNTQRRWKKKQWKMNVRALRFLGAEGMLADNYRKRERRKTGTICLAVAVFLIMLLVTAFGAEALYTVARYKTSDIGEVSLRMSEDEYAVYWNGENEQDRQEYEAFIKELEKNADVEKLSFWQDEMFLAQVSPEDYSKEYWDAYRDVMTQYYGDELDDARFAEMQEHSAPMFNVIAVDDDTLQELAKLTGADQELLFDEKEVGVIVLQEGVISTDGLGVEGRVAESYRYHEIGQMTDKQPGEVLEVKTYDYENDKEISQPVRIAGMAEKGQLAKYLDSQNMYLWVIMSNDNLQKMMQIGKIDGNGWTSFPSIRVKEKKGAKTLLGKLQELAQRQPDKVYVQTRDTQMMVQDIAGAILRIVDILLGCFVALTSVICLLNLFNSIQGWLAGRRREFAVLESVGMTKTQIRKMLVFESSHIMTKSAAIALLLSAGMMWMIQTVMNQMFGKMRIVLPWHLYLLAGLAAVASVIGMMLWLFERQHGNLLESIRNESV